MNNLRDNTLHRDGSATSWLVSVTAAHKRLAGIFSGIVMVVGCLALLGWVFDIAFLISIIPGLATMKVNTALAFVLSGLALNRLGKEKLPKALGTAKICAISVWLIAFLSLCEYGLGWNLGIDQFFIRDTYTVPSDFPGRMSEATAVCFLLAATAVYLLTQSRYLLAHSVTIVLGFVDLLALIGYMYDIDSLYGIFLFSSMAIHTAVAFALLSIGLLFVYPRQGIMTIILSNTISGMMFRRLIPAAVGLPLLLGALVLVGERFERYDFNFGTALLVVSMIAVFCLLIVWSGRSLYAVDLKRQESEAALREAEKKYRAIFENAVEGIYQSLPSGELITANSALARMLGYESAQALPQAEQQLHANRESYEAFRQMLEMYQVVHDFEVQLVCQDGGLIWASLNTQAVADKNGRLLYYEGTVNNITERKRLEAENERLTAQFFQAQKMESIGRLAGGIAHDFNNLLVPILGYAQIGVVSTQPGDKLHYRFTRIAEAAKRASSLVRQILAFSRQQILVVEILDLNEVITDFLPMFQSMVGEDMILQTHLVPDLHPVEVDKGQIEQVLMNLGVNARDAMPDGGSLIIETANVFLDEAYTAKHPELQPGAFVMLAVSDTGEGMDAVTQAKIFEPFFTTKPREKGTGLGLATVYGIVKQHRGNIWVYSEVDRGTTFKVYLPVAESAVSAQETIPPENALLQGTESILVVEDDAMVRQLVCETLIANGYIVLEAEDPEEALDFMSTYPNHIDLLLTDVIMPKINGVELYEQLVQLQPLMKVLYMSGYTDKVMPLHKKLDEGSKLLQKPFAIWVLLQKVREVLGQENSPDLSSAPTGR